MKKNLLRIFIVTIICFAKTVSAQVPNCGFENWLNGNPVDWQTTNIPIVPSAITPDPESLSGTFSVKGKVVSTHSGNPYQPYLGNSGFEISTPFTELNGNLKLFLHPGDRFIANIKMYNVSGEPIGVGKTIINSSISSWTKFSVAVNYSLPDPVICTIFFTITDSTLQASGQIGSYFIIDDLSLSGNASLQKHSLDKLIKIYPNPATDYFIIDWPEATDLNYIIYDQSGKNLSGIKHSKNKENIPVDLQSRGIYYLSITDNNQTVTKKLVVD